MSRLQSVFLRIYALLLRLYPAAFYAKFGEEMIDTFRLRLADQPQSALSISLREFGALLVAITHEHQRVNHSTETIPPRRALALLILPVLLGCGILLFRSPTFFYLSDKIRWLFGGLSVVILITGWLMERRLTVLALPSLGFMLYIAMWTYYNPPLGVQILVPFVALILTLLVMHWRGKQSVSWKLWLPGVMALPITGLVMSVIILWIDGSIGLPLRTLFRDYILGAFIPMGTLSLLILIGLPFASRFGTKTVLLLVGFLFFDLLGLSASLPYNVPQALAGQTYMVLFLLVIPLFSLRTTGRLHTRVLIPVALAYGILFIAKLLLGEWDITFVLYRTNEMLQTLIALYLAGEIYARRQRIPAEDATSSAGVSLSEASPT